MSEFQGLVISVTGKGFLDHESGEVDRIASEISDVREVTDGPVVVCVGGGDYHDEIQTNRLASDRDGMFRSLINAARLIGVIGSDAIGFSGIPAETLRDITDTDINHPLNLATGTRFYDWQPGALDLLKSRGEEGLLVAGGGVGHPFVRTDLSGSLWAASILENPSDKVAYLKSMEHERLTLSGRPPEESVTALKRTDYVTARNLGLPILDPTAWPILEGNGLVTLMYKEGRPSSIMDAIDGISGTRIEVDAEVSF